MRVLELDPPGRSRCRNGECPRARRRRRLPALREPATLQGRQLQVARMDDPVRGARRASSTAWRATSPSRSAPRIGCARRRSGTVCCSMRTRCQCGSTTSRRSHSSPSTIRRSATTATRARNSSPCGSPIFGRRKKCRRCSPPRARPTPGESTAACGTIARRTAKTILVEVVTHPLSVLDRPARLTLAHDVTERKRAERELRETNDTLQTLIQASPLAIVTTDINGTVSEWNVAAERMFGWFAGDVLGKPIPILPGEQVEDDVRRHADLGRALVHAATRRGARARTARSSTSTFRRPSSVGSAACSARCGSWPMSPSGRWWRNSCARRRRWTRSGQLAGGVAHDFNNLLTVITQLRPVPAQRAARSRIRVGRTRTRSRRRPRARRRSRASCSRSRAARCCSRRCSTSNEVIGDMERLLRRVISEDISLVTQFETEHRRGARRSRADRAGRDEPRGERARRDADGRRRSRSRRASCTSTRPTRGATPA